MARVVEEIGGPVALGFADFLMRLKFAQFAIATVRDLRARAFQSAMQIDPRIRLFLIGPYMHRKFVEGGLLAPDDPRALKIGFMKADPLRDPRLERAELQALLFDLARDPRERQDPSRRSIPRSSSG